MKISGYSKNIKLVVLYTVICAWEIIIHQINVLFKDYHAELLEYITKRHFHSPLYVNDSVQYDTVKLSVAQQPEKTSLLLCTPPPPGSPTLRPSCSESVIQK